MNVHPSDMKKVADRGDAKEALDILRAWAETATPEEIAGNEWNLNIPRYVDTFEEEVEIDLVAVRAERLRLKEELAELERKMDGYLTELGY